MDTSGFVHSFELDADHSLHLFQGSLVHVPADALVSSDDNFLSALSGVSLALAQVAGPEVHRERQQLVLQRRPRLADVVRTSGGGLPCRYLYHGITVEYGPGHDAPYALARRSHGEDALRDLPRPVFIDEVALRRLIVNLVSKASDDGVHSLGIPAFGTGQAFFDLADAAEIIIDELLVRLVETPIQNVTVALLGDDAQRLFYERLVRSRADRLASLALRRRADHPAPPSTKAAHAAAPSPPDLTVEQFPSLIDEARLATAAPGRLRLVEGLADLILKHAETDDLEQEILDRPECRDFRGTAKQRLMEFLYLSEEKLHLALGPALFKNKDLRLMAEELGDASGLPKDHNQLVNTILQALCFNTLTPPVGILAYIGHVEQLLADVRRPEANERSLETVVIEAGKLLEKALKDLLRLYGYLFFGEAYEEELVRRQIIQPRRDSSPIARLTIGQARQALQQLDAQHKRDPGLRAKLQALGRSADGLLPSILEREDPLGTDCQRLLQEVIELRNAIVHEGTPRDPQGDALRKLEALHAFFCTCQTTGAYPDVLRYEGMFENRSGERFVYFLDERGKERKVRTDERINARRHYYCFATNNPVHLHPTLIPKL